MPSSSLIPSDPSVLFTAAGMQQFKPYFLGEKSPYGENAVSCQKCLRTSDIDEVGDESHLTFFEMLGNFSFGRYGKKEAIVFAHDFIVKELGLKIEKVTVFDPQKIKNGDWRKEVPKDEESYDAWKKEIGFPQDKIFLEGVDNFWGPTGNEGPCGPTTEIYLKTKDGKSIEVWNLVFNEYFCDSQKKLKKLDIFGIDTGMGLERLAAVLQKKTSVFETDLFWPIVKKIEELSARPYLKNEKLFRIIADHMKGSVFLIANGILPSNLEQGYVLRRFLRRAIRYGKLLNLPENFLISLAKEAIEIYKDIYFEVKSKENDVLTVIQKEEEKFGKTLDGGLKELHKTIEWFRVQDTARDISPESGYIENANFKKTASELGKKLFFLYQSYGFPLELSLEEFEKFWKVEVFFKEDVKKAFEEELKKHQEISRAGVEKKFGGHATEKAETEEDKIKITKLHTATHLLHWALREVLGEHVRQMGSDINPERLRFDFAHTQKMTAEELKKVEDLVNQKIKEDLAVKKEEMDYEEALRLGALAFAFFSARGGSALGGKERYPEKVSVYTIGNWSKEICAGPHVERTGQMGTFKIIKEESCQAGVRRIKAALN